MAPKFSHAETSTAAFQPVATRVSQPTFTAVAASRVEPAVETAVVAQPVKAIEVSVPTGGPVFTTPIQNIRFIDPAFAQNIINLRTPTEGLPRGQINVPVSPSENVTDELIFEGASEIGIHELCHSAFGLADEYEYYGGNVVRKRTLNDSVESFLTSQDN